MDHLFKLPDGVEMTHGYIDPPLGEPFKGLMFKKEWIQTMEPIEVNNAAEAITLIKVFGDIAELIMQHPIHSQDLAQIIKDGAHTYQLANTNMFIIKNLEDK